MLHKQFAVLVFAGLFVMLNGGPAKAALKNAPIEEDEDYMDILDDDDDDDDDDNNDDNDDNNDNNYDDEGDGGDDEPFLGTGEDLLLKAGTMQAGGQISFQIDVRKAPDEDGTSTNGGGTFTFAPTAGYFIIDNLELLAGLGFVIPFGDANFGGKNIFFDVGARYFLLQFSIFNLYVGGSMGLNFWIADTVDDSGDETTQTLPSFVLSVPAGLMMAINKHIAIDLGMRLNFNIGFGDYKDNFTMAIPIGYFGVQGFFELF